jgi:protein-tyrosine phosphatase
MKHLIFVCHGNICRSPMAAFVMQALLKEMHLEGSYSITSAATSTEELGHGVHPGTRRTCEAHHIAWDRQHHAHQITVQEAATCDLILTMDSANVRNLKRMLPIETHPKIRPLLSYANLSRDIADPWYTGDFETTYQDVLLGCKALLKTLQSP